VSIAIKYYGHSCFEVQISGKNILFDPFISPNPKAKDVDIKQINPDYILVSHGHGDHIADCVAIAEQSKAQVVSTFEITEWLSKQGLENLVPMNTGGSYDLGVAKIKLVRAEHSSSLPDGSYGGNPVGFLVESKEGNFYYAGDTALTLDMKLIPDWIKLDFSILPVGDHFTMGIEDAATAAQWVQSKKIIGMHFDTFPPIEINHDQAKQYFSDKQLELFLPTINQTLEL
jgi:L-ascorbate metabolism protein UlaG (beta-lactamase superfamily)